MDKYYTPSIEDIKIGYNLELVTSYETSNSLTEEWKPIVFSKNFGGFDDSIDMLEFYISRHEVRTKYLTKEQIESEGWKLDKYSFLIADFSEGDNSKDEHLFRFFKKDYSVIFHNEKREITIRNKEDIIYSGNCPSINEFRYITKKLLKIE